MEKKKKVLLIQPHSDDILFSASKFLFESKKYKKVKMLTVENVSEKRILEDVEICKHFNIDLIIPDTKISSEDFHKEYYHQYKEMDDVDCLNFCKKKIGSKNINKLATELSKIIKKHKDEGYLIVSCLGVGHPFHWLINFLTADYSDLFYRDFPHSFKRRNQNYFNFVTENEFELDFNHFDEKEHSEKFELISKFYKSQKSLLFFEKRYIDKKLPEQYFKKKQDE